MEELLPFNEWSRERIRQGRKQCTSRTRKYDDPRVDFVIQAPIWFIIKYLWRLEGADSPEELVKVLTLIFKNLDANRILYVHFGDFSKKIENANL